ncbi:MAG: nucleoside deaminase [Planctomycetales bacterium]|nr:nucleoside deaminase [Planctomycetales bacterium]
MDAVQLMRLAIDKAYAGVAAGQSPFGCAIARGDTLLAVAHNTVLQSVDITAHAEINALRQACAASGEILLEGVVVATTCEPCPMCMAALHWARVEAVCFGASIADAADAGFNELQLPAESVVRLGGSRVQLVAGVLQEDCVELFRAWRAQPNRRAY